MAALRDPYAVISRFVPTDGEPTFGDYVKGQTFTIHQEDRDGGVFIEHRGCRLRYVGDVLCFDRGAGALGRATWHGRPVPFVFDPADS